MVSHIQRHMPVKCSQNMSVTMAYVGGTWIYMGTSSLPSLSSRSFLCCCNRSYTVESSVEGSSPSGKSAQWNQTIAKFDVKIRYRPGRAHGNADALSTSPMEDESAEIAGVVNPVAVDCSEMAEQQRQDLKLQVLMDYMEQGVLPSDEKLIS